jgi:hydroxyacylglutathione hydrolase
MPITIRQFPCLADNYGFLVRDEASGLAACIDTPDADAILRELESAGWRLALILNTHWHPDHAGGDAAVQAATGAAIVGPAEVRKIAPLDREVAGGDIVALGETQFEVLETGGHTLGHLSFYDAADGVAFVGDTLFAMGCGRLFEGEPAQMWESLTRLAALPDDTAVYCAHEYTESNARFALSVDSSDAVRARADQVFDLRRQGRATVPTSIRMERETNPFLRAPELAAAVGVSSDDPVAAFAALRAAKDSFKT